MHLVLRFTHGHKNLRICEPTLQLQLRDFLSFWVPDTLVCLEVLDRRYHGKSCATKFINS